MVYEVGDSSLILATVLVLAVLVGALVVLNMLVGVLVDIVGQVTAREKDTMAYFYVKCLRQVPHRARVPGCCKDPLWHPIQQITNIKNVKRLDA